LTISRRDLAAILDAMSDADLDAACVAVQARMVARGKGGRCLQILCDCIDRARRLAEPPPPRQVIRVDFGQRRPSPGDGSKGFGGAA
jgi:hypothetical protein